MGQNQQKFLTAETTTKVAAPDGVLENSPEFLQYGIPSIMPESIIHLFEVIQVSQGHPKGKTMSSSAAERSEEHTSELQSRPHLVCRLLLEKKKKTTRKY